jgi:hypothetical protein
LIRYLTTCQFERGTTEGSKNNRKERKKITSPENKSTPDKFSLSPLQNDNVPEADRLFFYSNGLSRLAHGNKKIDSA